MSDVLVKKILAQRESSFEILPGKFLKLRRPGEVQMVALRGGISRERLQTMVVGWEGFTEADLLGPTVGASDKVPFSADVFGTWIEDRATEYAKVCHEVMRLIDEHLKAKEQAGKN